MISNRKSKVKLNVRGAATSWAPEKNNRPKRKPVTRWRDKPDLSKRTGKELEIARRRRVIGLSRFLASLAYRHAGS